MPNLSTGAWFALIAPKGMPDIIVGKLNSAVTEILREPEVQAQFANPGVQSGTDEHSGEVQ